MHDEMESLEKNGTWDLVKLPREKKPIRGKKVFLLMMRQDIKQG